MDKSKVFLLDEWFKLDDENVLNRVAEIKLHNKERLANYIKETTGIEVNPHSIFDIQVKRLHEYKRQY